MKKLIIAEKPSVGKDIARALGVKHNNQGYIDGNEYIVTWAMGHLVTLQEPEGYNSKYKSWELDFLPIIPEKIQLNIIPQTSKQFKTIQGLLKQASEVIIATDAGREGELVARWILEQAKSKLPIKRLWISSVTDKAIKDGFKNLKDGKKYVNLYHSAFSRAVADWLVGINATRALTTKFGASLSCGRVQTPTLAIINKREDDIRNFKSREFYSIVFTHKGVKFAQNLQNKIFDKTYVSELLKNMQGNSAKVTDVKTTQKKSQIQGYDLTTLQQDANRLYGFSAKDTLNYMQQLYERHKIVTYPRTDSKYISSDMVSTLHERIRAVNFGEFKTVATKLLKDGVYTNVFVNNAKVTDHHAIIPTEEIIDMSELGSGELKIYKLVIRKFLGAVSKPYEYEHTVITVSINDNEFIARGNVVINLGYKEVYSKELEENDEDEGQRLPMFKKGQLLEGTFAINTSKTVAPNSFTEGTLLMAMENPQIFMESDNKSLTKILKETGGLGTVATRADIIEKLFSIGVIEERGKYLSITQKGKQLLQIAPKELKSPKLTAEWEQQLYKISLGDLEKETFINEIKLYTKEIVKEIKASQSTFKHTNITNHKCEACDKQMLEIQGKKGKYLVCQDRGCGTKRNLEIITNTRCPKCYKKLVLLGNDTKQMFVCKCGHKESKEAFNERKKRESNVMNKKDIKNYMDKINKEDSKANNAFAELSKLKF